MNHLSHLIEQYGLWAAFVNVFVEQIGAPVPAWPTLIVAGALSGKENYSAFTLLLCAVIAALLADLCWYYAGKYYGRRVMAMLCRVSLTPDACISKTQSVYMRWGAPSLMVAKFIPGFASIASGLAGSAGTKLSTYILFDTIGAILWAGLAIFLGSLFHSTIDSLLHVIAQLGKLGALLVVGALVLYMVIKWSQRFLLIRSLRMSRISVDELSVLIEQGISPVIIDVRSKNESSINRIPGALPLSFFDIAAYNPIVPENGEVIVYCSCPNEISAAKVAKALLQKGYKKVRPLYGGIDAWIAAGHPIEI
jgi:membrane protein DedA with SNARE-associated domain/rhodanese-related sulfurtransferase